MGRTQLPCHFERADGETWMVFMDGEKEKVCGEHVTAKCICTEAPDHDGPHCPDPLELAFCKHDPNEY